MATSSGAMLASQTLSRRKSLVSHIIDGEEAVLLKVELFLSELERRLERLEKVGELSLDTSISRAYSTLLAVRAKCSQVSEGVIGAGRRRLQVMVETLDTRYHEALVSAGSMNEQAKVGIELMDAMLTEWESRALKLRDQGLANAAGAADSLMDEGRRVVDEGIERAKRAAESLEEHIQSAMHRAKERLLQYEELPVPWRVNPWILKGYRFQTTWKGCVQSIFRPSNETVNIWSHVLGLVVILAIAFYFFPLSVNFSVSTKTDVVIFGLFFFAACKCLACSSVWHTMNCVADETLLERFACVDYTGIALLIAASIMTTEYTAFYCEPVSRWIYITATGLFGIGGVIIPWHPYFNGADKAWLRVAFFIGLAATGFIPVVQVVLTRGFRAAWEIYFCTNLLKSLAVYGAGAVVYAAKVPERWYPGLFDYFGNAHNVWHIAVLGGILYHYVAMHDFFASAFRRAQNECPAM